MEVDVGDIVTVSLNRPEVLNAIDTELATALESLLKRLHEHPPKPLLLRGNGEATCSGVDTAIVSNPDFEAENVEFRHTIHEVFDLLRLYGGPVGFAGKGAVVGAGMVLAANSDFVVLADDTTLMFPEIKLGLLSRPTMVILADTVGDRLAKEIVLTGEPITPERAREIGLVNCVVRAADVVETTRRYLDQTREYDAELVASAKHTINRRDAKTFWNRNEADLRGE
nr:enoyl-CoA hydratase/isomerase family protein [Halomarina salina]